MAAADLTVLDELIVAARRQSLAASARQSADWALGFQLTKLHQELLKVVELGLGIHEDEAQIASILE
ncbi:MAG: hypothetical protein WBG92_03215 [Thiohalocapsa sp.]